MIAMKCSYPTCYLHSPSEVSFFLLAVWQHCFFGGVQTKMSWHSLLTLQ